MHITGVELVPGLEGVEENLVVRAVPQTRNRESEIGVLLSLFCNYSQQDLGRPGGSTTAASIYLPSKGYYLNEQGKYDPPHGFLPIVIRFPASGLPTVAEIVHTRFLQTHQLFSQLFERTNPKARDVLTEINNDPVHKALVLSYRRKTPPSVRKKRMPRH